MRMPLILLCVTLAAPLFAQTQTKTPSPSGGPTTVAINPAVPTNVHQLFLDDQNDRGGNMPSPAYGADDTTRDAVRRAQVKALLAAGKIQTARDFHDAAYIYQHGQEADDYMLAHILALEAVVKGDATSKWISAASLDRYLQTIGRSQVFGTQYLTKQKPESKATSTGTAAATSAITRVTTQEPFDSALMPDALRSDFCVPNLDQQKLNVKEFESGRYPSQIVPAGCTR